MRKKAAFIWTLLVFAAINFAIYEKEAIIKNGEPVFLELAPVDPRSLMQGDYMRLRYKISPRGSTMSGKRHKKVVVRINEKNVAEFVRLDDGSELSPDEKLFRLQKRSIVPDSFMFQEGTGDRYNSARYGVFKFDGQRKYILTGLADKDFKMIE